MKKYLHKLPFTVGRRSPTQGRAAEAGSAKPSLQQLQTKGFELITEIVNFGRPSSLAPIEPTGGPDDLGWCAESLGFDVANSSVALGKTGVLLALTRFSTRALEADRMGSCTLALHEETWPCEMSPAARDVKAGRERLTTLRVGSALPLQLVMPSGRKLPSMRSKAARLLLAKYRLIDLYRRNPGRFMEEQVYTLPEDALEELRTEDPSLAPWWPRWMAKARTLPPLTHKTASRWFDVIWVLVLDEYRGYPAGLDSDLQKVSRSKQHPFFEDQESLVCLGHTAAAKRKADYVLNHMPLVRCSPEVAARVHERAKRAYRRHLPVAIRARLREVWLRFVAKA